MYYKKIYAALLSISIFALVSCATTENTTGQDKDSAEKKNILTTQADILGKLPSKPAVEGNILFSKKTGGTLNKNDIRVSLGERHTFGGEGFRISNASKSKVLIEYNNFEREILLSYDFERDRNPDYDGNYNSGEFCDIRIKKMPPKYDFNVIAKMHWIPWLFRIGVSEIEWEGIYKEDLPAPFAEFSINGKSYQIKLSTISVQRPLFTNMTDDELLSSHKTSLRKMIRDENQIYIITDDSGTVFASFDSDSYKIYENSGTVADDFISVIGVYTGIFQLLNAY